MALVITKFENSFARDRETNLILLCVNQSDNYALNKADHEVVDFNELIFPTTTWFTKDLRQKSDFLTLKRIKGEQTKFLGNTNWSHYLDENDPILTMLRVYHQEIMSHVLLLLLEEAEMAIKWAAIMRYFRKKLIIVPFT